MALATEDRLAAFRTSIAPDFYTPEEFILWGEVEAILNRLKPAIEVLQELSTLPDASETDLTQALTCEPKVLEVLRILLAAPKAVGFEDGRELPENLPRTNQERRELAAVLLDLGIRRLLNPSANVRALATVGLIARNANQRRFRVRKRFEHRVEQLIRGVSREILDTTSVRLEQVPLYNQPPAARRVVDYVLAENGRPFVAITTVYQTQSGGRQQRDLTLTYPTLQRRLDEVPLGLILIADGRGIKQAPQRVLKSLLEEVSACMTLKQAEAGALREAIMRFAETGGRRKDWSVPLNRLVENALESFGTVRATELPAPTDTARLTLAQYAETRADYALTLSVGGETLSWSRSELVERAQKLIETTQRGHSDSIEAVRLFADLLGVSYDMVNLEKNEDGFQASMLGIQSDPVLPEKLLAVGYGSNVDSAVLRAVAKLALNHTPEAKVATLIVPSVEEASFLTDVQSTLTASVTVVSYDDLLQFAKHAAPPRDNYVAMILERSDLTKVSPFVLRSVTPARMFFGREEEQATILSTLATNSVALLGGRRIGKTSLLQRAKQRLEEANFRPFYGDCQVVLDWDDFGQMACRNWKVKVPEPFEPQHLFSIVSQLNDESGRQLVFILDEIDQLLKWDQSHTHEEVPEAFFRACRTLSQEGTVQFVFSGERTIAQKLWDPHSPHWNFCRPLPLQQLSRDASERLLVNPIHALQIAIEDDLEFCSEAWRRTSGHPQILQYLGDRLVRGLNERPAGERGVLSSSGLQAAAESYDFAEHYLETYWGQSVPLERLISVLVADGVESPPGIASRLRYESIDVMDDDVTQALRMLDLYGIIKKAGTGYILRAEWFPEALSYYGGIEQATTFFIEKLK
jgi:hypothetical protein